MSLLNAIAGFIKKLYNCCFFILLLLWYLIVYCFFAFLVLIVSGIILSLCISFYLFVIFVLYIIIRTMLI